MTTFSEFYDLRLVAVYDTLNPIAEYERFYLDLAHEAFGFIYRRHRLRHGAADLRAGQARSSARRRRALGRDARCYAAAPRLRAGAMVEGDARRLGEVGRPRDHDRARGPDHPRHEAWSATLQAVRRAFARPAATWRSRAATPRPSVDRVDPQASAEGRRSTLGPVEVSVQDLEDRRRPGALRHPLPLRESGEELVSPTELRFRTRPNWADPCRTPGFTVQEVFGDWDGRPADASGSELIFIAARG